MRVELPFLAEGVEGGDVVQVLVQEGDQVTEGQSLIELETDKATVPVPAPSAGKVTHLLVKKGDHLKVGQALVELNGEGESAPQKTAASKTAADKPADEKSSDKKPAQPSESPGQCPVRTGPAAAAGRRGSACQGRRATREAAGTTVLFTYVFCVWNENSIAAGTSGSLRTVRIPVLQAPASLRLRPYAGWHASSAWISGT